MRKTALRRSVGSLRTKNRRWKALGSERNESGRRLKKRKKKRSHGNVRLTPWKSSVGGSTGRLSAKEATKGDNGHTSGEAEAKIGLDDDAGAGAEARLRGGAAVAAATAADDDGK